MVKCSLMFAYVRLMGEKLSRALGAATGERGKRADFKFLTVRSLISAWTRGGYGNAEGAARSHRGRAGRQKEECRMRPRALRAAIADYKMHDARRWGLMELAPPSTRGNV